VTLPPDLVAEVIEALYAATEELDSLEAIEEWPLPDDVELQLDLAETLIAVLQRIYDATDDDGRRRIDDMIHEEAGRSAHYSGIGPPVLPEVRRQLDATLEALRRRALSDQEVADVLRSVR
jgi:hypothetical protein